MVLVDGPVRLAFDVRDIFVRGTILPAGLIAEGMSCYTMPPDLYNWPPGVTVRLAGCLSLQMLLPLTAISRPYQI